MDPVQVSVTVWPTLVGTVTVLEGGVDACEVPTPIIPTTSPTASMAWKSTRLRSVATMPTRVRLMGPLPVIGRNWALTGTLDRPEMEHQIDRRCRPESTVTSADMHPEIVAHGPGRCPKCGMDLEPRDPAERKSKPARFADSTCPRFFDMLAAGGGVRATP